jgi:hypothetical protein
MRTDDDISLKLHHTPLSRTLHAPGSQVGSVAFVMVRILMLTSVAEAKLPGACLVLYHDPSPPVCLNGGGRFAYQANVKKGFKAGVAVSHLAALSRPFTS